MSAFVDYLGFTTCTGGEETGSKVALVPIASFTTMSQPVYSLIPSSTTLINSSLTSTLGSVQTSPSISAIPKRKPSKGLRTPAKVGICIGVSAAGTIILFFAFHGILRYRKRKIRGRAEKQEATSEEHQPYFQQKGELEAEERRKYELEAEERRYELEDNEINEMPTMEINKENARGRLELRGEEHCKELNGSESSLQERS